MLLLGVFAFLTGCNGPEPLTPNASGFRSPITPADITYNELAARYNETAEQLGTLWCRTDVVIEWRDAYDDGEGEVRREKGEGKFMFRTPRDTALLVEKLGQIYLWAGSSEKGYWLFDLADSDAKKAYLGTYDQPGQAHKKYPLPVRPETVPHLLGVVPLPTFADSAQQPPVDLYRGQYLVELTGKRLLVDPETFRPARVDLTDQKGYSLLTAKLEGGFPVQVPGVRKTRWPSICERAEFYVPGYEFRLTVAMDEATNDPRRVRDQMFDFDALRKGLKPQKVISLSGD